MLTEAVNLVRAGGGYKGRAGPKLSHQERRARGEFLSKGLRRSCAGRHFPGRGRGDRSDRKRCDSFAAAHGLPSPPPQRHRHTSFAQEARWLRHVVARFAVAGLQPPDGSSGSIGPTSTAAGGVSQR